MPICHLPLLIHPRKLTCAQKQANFNRKGSPSNPYSSGRHVSFREEYYLLQIHPFDFHLLIMIERITGWWFQPIWKIWPSNWIISPEIGVKIKNIWNHHPVMIERISLIQKPVHPLFTPPQNCDDLRLALPFVKDTLWWPWLDPPTAQKPCCAWQSLCLAIYGYTPDV